MTLRLIKPHTVSRGRLGVDILFFKLAYKIGEDIFCLHFNVTKLFFNPLLVLVSISGTYY